MSDGYFSGAIKNTHMLEGKRKCAEAATGKSITGFSVKLKASRRAR